MVTLRRWLDTARVGATAGFIVGVADGSGALLAGQPESATEWLALPSAGALSALVGVIAWSLWEPVGRRLGEHLSLAGLWRRLGLREAAAGAGRERWSALLAAVTVTGLVACGVGYFILTEAFRLQDIDFAIELLLFLAIVGTGVGAISVWLLWGWFTPVFQWLTARGGVPWPLRALLGWLPPVTLLSYFVAAHHDALGQVAWFPYLLTLGLTAMVLRQVARNLAGPRRVLERAMEAVLAAMLLLLAGSAALLTRIPTATAVLDQTAHVRLALGAVQTLSDFDRDGHASLFGGHDCAAFNGAIHPGAEDVSGNGVDEDCSGTDSDPAAPEQERYPTFSQALKHDQIRQYNFVLIVIDALRADRLGKKRKGKSLTPAIDRFAREALRFDGALSQSSSTRISFPSFLSGRIPAHIAWKKQGHRYQIDSAQPMLQQVLGKAGYRTGLVANKWFLEHVPSLKRGFEEFLDVWQGENFRKARKGSAPSSTTRAIEFIESTPKDAAFFLGVYYEGPHAPYHDLKRFGFPARGKGAAQRYESEIAFADHQVGFLLSYLRAKSKLWKNTVVFLFADHGEEFGEHGGKHHSRTCYQESVHVPLLLRIPGIKPKRLRPVVSLVDIVPTILELTGRQSAMPTPDGVSLLHAMAGTLPTDRPSYCTVFSDKDPQSTLLRSVRKRDWTLIRRYRGDRLELYHSGSDKGEQHNLANSEQHQDQQRALLELLDAGQPPRFAKHEVR